MLMLMTKAAVRRNMVKLWQKFSSPKCFKMREMGKKASNESTPKYED